MFKQKLNVILLMLLAVSVCAGLEYGQEFQIGFPEDCQVSNPVVCALTNGNFVVYWNRVRVQYSNYDSDLDLLARIYSNNGEPATEPFLVGEGIQCRNESAVITALAEGAFVVSWFCVGRGAQLADVYTTFFSASGEVMRYIKPVNGFTKMEAQRLWMIRMDAKTVRVLWLANGYGFRGIYSRLLDVEGAGESTEHRVEEINIQYGSRINYNLAGLDNGNLLFCGGIKSSEQSPYFQILTPSGSIIKQADVFYHTNHKYEPLLQIVSLSDGGFVLLWIDGYGQIFNADGSPATDCAPLLQSDYGGLYVRGEPIGDGGFLIYGESYNQAYSILGVLAKFYFKGDAGSTCGFSLPNSRWKSQPDACLLTSNDFVMVWLAKTGCGNSLFGQRMPPLARHFPAKSFELLWPTNDVTLKSSKVAFYWQNANTFPVFYPWESLYYYLYLSTTADFTDAWTMDVTPDTFVTVTDLAPGHTYFCKVLAVDNRMDSVWSKNSGAFFIRHDATAVTDVPPLPEAFSLNQNYPNPFNASTTITFALPCKGGTTLCVYDITGRLITEVFNDDLDPGRHACVWNGCNANGATLPSGVYLCRLEQITVTGRRNTRMMKLNLVR